MSSFYITCVDGTSILDEELTQTWLSLGLTAIDIILIVLMFRGI